MGWPRVGVRRTMIRPLIGALALLAFAARAASAHDAEIFASNNTAVITDAADPRLDDPPDRVGATRASRLIEDGGGRVRGSDLLDGVFFSAEAGTTTFERSRVFAVGGVEPRTSSTRSPTRSARGSPQQSVLTFDRLAASDPARRGRARRAERHRGRAAHRAARRPPRGERLFGGSVTQADHLRLVAALADRQFALDFAQRIGGDTTRATRLRRPRVRRGSAARAGRAAGR